LDLIDEAVEWWLQLGKKQILAKPATSLQRDYKKGMFIATM
jgi:hypothetical protein